MLGLKPCDEVRFNQRPLPRIIDHPGDDAQPKSPARRAAGHKARTLWADNRSDANDYFFTVVRSDNQIMSLLLGEATLSCRLLL